MQCLGEHDRWPSWRTGVALALMLFGCGQPPPAPSHELAIANGNTLRIVDTAGPQELQQVTGFQEIFGLVYRPDGARLALTDCSRNEVLELDAGNYTELASLTSGASCPWDAGYNGNGTSLAATVPVRPNPLGALFGHLRVVGPQPLDRDLGRPLLAVAYRPGGQELAVGTPQGLTVLGTGTGYPQLHQFPTIGVISLAYSVDGTRLFVGTPGGFGVLDAAASYAVTSSAGIGPVLDVAVGPAGSRVAFVGQGAVSLRDASTMTEIAALTTTNQFRAADFSPDGALLAVAETADQVRLFDASVGTEFAPVPAQGRIDAIAFRPTLPRTPVLFVHGHSRTAQEAWMQDGADTSFSAALGANPSLTIDPFFLELPVHGGSDTAIQARSIADDATDILAAIEGGADSGGVQQTGILNMPAYQALSRVAVVAFSQGTLSSRYYIKNLMGSRVAHTITVSEFVTLAAPNHGISLTCANPNQPDRARRQLCAGHRGLVLNIGDSCGSCTPNPPTFGSNLPGDDTFITDLNGAQLDCSATPNPDEAPLSRPSTPDGILYVNMYGGAPGDEFVGGGPQTLDCLGRRLAQNLAPDATNIPIDNVPSTVHANFPHHWETICLTLRTIVDHQPPPAPAQACQGLTHP